MWPLHSLHVFYLHLSVICPSVVCLSICLSQSFLPTKIHTLFYLHLYSLELSNSLSPLHLEPTTSLRCPQGLVLASRVLKSGLVQFFSLFERQLNWTDSFGLPKGVGLAIGLKATSCNQLPPNCDQLQPVLDYQSLNMVIMSCDWPHSVSSGT